MGFSIGSLFKTIAGPIIGGIIGGPFGGIIGGGITQALVRPPSFKAVTTPGPTVRSRQVVSRLPGALLRPGAALLAGAGVVAELLRASREATGLAVNAKKIRESVRVCGIELTAQTFGLTESEICTIVVSIRKRRARGISAADLRRTRSTIRKVHNIQHDLKALSPATRHHHHRRAK